MQWRSNDLHNATRKCCNKSNVTTPKDAASTSCCSPHADPWVQAHHQTLYRGHSVIQASPLSCSQTTSHQTSTRISDANVCAEKNKMFCNKNK